MAPARGANLDEISQRYLLRICHREGDQVGGNLGLGIVIGGPDQPAAANDQKDDCRYEPGSPRSLGVAVTLVEIVISRGLVHTGKHRSEVRRIIGA